MALLLTTCGGGSLPPAEVDTVTGTVQDNAGAKLPGATVSASTTPPVTTTTDLDGAFSLRVPLQVTGSAFTLTVAKTCYGAPSTKRITRSSNAPLDTGVTTLTLTLLPTTATDNDRYTFTQKPDGSYKLTVNCVTAIPQSKFSTFNAPVDGLTKSPILQGLAIQSGKAIDVVLTEIKLPPTLKTIEKGAFYDNAAVSGNLTIPRNVETIGDRAFNLLGSSTFSGTSSGTIASSRAPAITFETGSKLTSIGANAFDSSGSKVALVLPEGLTTIGAEAFNFFVMPAADLVIPQNVSSIGEKAFSAFEGINDGVTIRSAKLAKPSSGATTTLPLGNNLFGTSTSSSESRSSTITTIKLPLAVYNSYTATERTAIFGSEVTAYQDLAGNAH